MREPAIVESKANTFYLKKKGISKGCQQCLRGAKAVLFLNGICQNPRHCWWYCPISKNRKGKEDTYINEIKITSKEQILQELKAINAKGISITGGDPLFEPNLEKKEAELALCGDITQNDEFNFKYHDEINEIPDDFGVPVCHNSIDQCAAYGDAC